MSDGPPTEDRAVSTFLDYVALAFIFVFVEQLTAGKWLISLGALGAALTFHIVGIKWPQIKLRAGARFSSSVDRVANRQYLRAILTVVFLVCSLYLLQALVPTDFIMHLHERLHGWLGFVVIGLIGTVVSCGYWWLTGRMLSPPPAPAASTSISSDDDSQYQLLNLSPQQKAELDRLKATLFQYKAKVLDMPEYYKAKVAKNEFRTLLEDLEGKHGCLIDVSKVQCLPKPPATITENQVEIDISVKMVADELSKTFFWMIRNKHVKVRVPIALYISLTNRQTTPRKIDVLYLDAKSVDGWADIRTAESLYPEAVETMSQKPLVLQAKNACASMKGEYLLPSLYDRVIQPGDKAEGWIIAEYPKGFKYGNSIGDIRISLLAGNHWIASKTFPANPRVYNDHPFDWYFTPLDTLITEEW